MIVRHLRTRLFFGRFVRLSCEIRRVSDACRVTLSGRRKSRLQDPYLLPDAIGRLVALEVAARVVRSAFMVGSKMVAILTMSTATRLAREGLGAFKFQRCDPRCIYQLAN